jgi:hypothetical protein
MRSVHKVNTYAGLNLVSVSPSSRFVPQSPDGFRCRTELLVYTENRWINVILDRACHIGTLIY